MKMEGQANREKEIFERALDFGSAEERDRFIEEACAGNSALRARVSGLLLSLECSQFLPEAPGVVLQNGTVLATIEKPGQKIGRYKLREMVGEGGCGIVYVAEQEEPVRRRVALKV